MITNAIIVFVFIDVICYAMSDIKPFSNFLYYLPGGGIVSLYLNGARKCSQ